MSRRYIFNYQDHKKKVQDLKKNIQQQGMNMFFQNVMAWFLKDYAYLMNCNYKQCNEESEYNSFTEFAFSLFFNF